LGNSRNLSVFPIASPSEGELIFPRGNVLGGDVQGVLRAQCGSLVLASVRWLWVVGFDVPAASLVAAPPGRCSMAALACLTLWTQRTVESLKDQCTASIQNANIPTPNHNKCHQKTCFLLNNKLI
jgi:hypothetical protein